MGAFQGLVRVVAGIMIAVSLLHFLLGVGGAWLVGAKLPAEVLSNPILDSQDRFYGTLLGGLGLLVLYCLSDLRTYGGVLKIVCWTVFAGGLGRILSIAQTSLPSRELLALLAIELIVPPLIVWKLPTAIDQR